MSDMCYELTCCPQCHQGISTSTNRLVQDSCGHKKCRMCLLQEDKGCVACGNVSRYDTDHGLLSHEMQIAISDSHRRHCLEPQYDVPDRGITDYYPEARNDDRFHHRTADSPVDRNASADSDIGPRSPEGRLPTPTPPPSPPPVLQPPPTRVKKKRKPMVIPPHVTVSEESPPNYTCTICARTFGARVHVRYHRYCDGATDKPHRCDRCDRTFASKSHLDYHVRGHAGERPHVCTLCKKAFGQRGKLTRHLRTHSQDRPFVCSVCGRAFKDLDALASHRGTHGERKPHVCDACGRGFALRSNLKKHALTHTGEKNYMCDECGRSFTLKCVLTVHIASHSRARPFGCKTCSRTFAVRKDLVRHQSTHSKTRPFGCPLCGLAFPRKDNFLRHMKNNHQNKCLSPVTVRQPKSPPVGVPRDLPSTATTPSLCDPPQATCPDRNVIPHLINDRSDSQEETIKSSVSKSDINDTYSRSDSASPYRTEHSNVVVNNFTSSEIKENADLSSVTPSKRAQVIQQLDMSEAYRESNRTCVVTMASNNEADRSSIGSQSPREPITRVASPPRTPSYQAVPVINRWNVGRSVDAPAVVGTGATREPSNCVRTITRTWDVRAASESPRKETTSDPAPEVGPGCDTALGPELESYDNPEKPTLRLYLSDVHWRKRIMELLNLKKEPSTDSLVYDKSSVRTSEAHKERLVLNKSDGQAGDGGSRSCNGDNGRKSSPKTPTHSTQNSKYARSQSNTNTKLLQKVPCDNQSKIHSRIVPAKQEVHNVGPPIIYSNSSVHGSNDGFGETERMSDDGSRVSPSLQRLAHAKPVIVENKSIQH